MPQPLYVCLNKTIGHGRETAGKTNKIMHIARIAHMADDIGQIAQHQIVVVRLGVQETRLRKSLGPPLDLTHQTVAHHQAQRFGFLRPTRQ